MTYSGLYKLMLSMGFFVACVTMQYTVTQRHIMQLGVLSTLSLSLSLLVLRSPYFLFFHGLVEEDLEQVWQAASSEKQRLKDTLLICVSLCNFLSLSLF